MNLLDYRTTGGHTCTPRTFSDLKKLLGLPEGLQVSGDTSEERASVAKALAKNSVQFRDERHALGRGQ